MRQARRLAALGLLALLLCSQPAQASPAVTYRIMPLGDSITSALPGQASYRYWLWKLIGEAGYPADFVGSLWGVYDDGSAPLYPDFDANHEGHYGYRADQVLANITVWAQAAAPDVVLIHLGHNDLWYAQSIDSTISEISQIIDRLRAVNPRVKVLLAQLIPSAYGGELDRIPLLNARIPGLVASKNTALSPVRLVDQYTGFDPVADTVDLVHPDESGEKKIAARWFEVFDRLMRQNNSFYLPVIQR